MAYIGKSPTGTGVRSRYYYTATGGETSLSGADDNSNTLVFSDGNYVDVSLNGIALVAGTDYNTSTANTIGGLAALSASDIVEVVVYDIFTVADTVSAKDGGTFSGNVAMGGTLSVTGASTATGGLNVGTIKEATGTTTAMTIDSSGRILTPARPAFFAYLTSTQALNSASDIDITQYLTSIDFNIGNHYSAANGFQAPIDGIYHFDFGFYTYSVSYSELFIYKNGTKFQRFSNILAASAVNPFSSRSSTTLSLSSGDEIKLYHSATTATLFNADRVTFFSGFLLG